MYLAPADEWKTTRTREVVRLKRAAKRVYSVPGPDRGLGFISAFLDVFGVFGVFNLGRVLYFDDVKVLVLINVR